MSKKKKKGFPRGEIICIVSEMYFDRDDIKDTILKAINQANKTIKASGVDQGLYYQAITQGSILTVVVKAN